MCVSCMSVAAPNTNAAIGSVRARLCRRAAKVAESQARPSLPCLRRIGLLYASLPTVSCMSPSACHHIDWLQDVQHPRYLYGYVRCCLPVHALHACRARRDSTPFSQQCSPYRHPDWKTATKLRAWRRNASRRDNPLIALGRRRRPSRASCHLTDASNRSMQLPHGQPCPHDSGQQQQARAREQRRPSLRLRLERALKLPVRRF